MEHHNKKINKKPKIKKQPALQLMPSNFSVFEYFQSIKKEREKILEELKNMEGGEK